VQRCSPLAMHPRTQGIALEVILPAVTGVREECRHARLRVALSRVARAGQGLASHAGLPACRFVRHARADVHAGERSDERLWSAASQTMAHGASARELLGRPAADVLFHRGANQRYLGEIRLWR